ncbi:DUF3795 domain-containing protein [Candidatus Thorarchaeota archaeon]|nr:MAG: DUF3795 domain-containing protein [Candidatus Thorarchaeota archaeon]
MSLKENLCRCGIYCGQCWAYRAVIPRTASTLKEMIVKDLSYLRDTDLDFDFDEFVQNLDYFAKMEPCKGRNEETTWCDVKKCSRIKNDEVDNCLLCELFAECERTEYVRGRYSYLFDHVKIIQEEGLGAYLEGEEKKARDGVRLPDIRDY